ncbi:MAG: Y-family DNA polymerase [Alphaproteobacteria bacterium]|nr:Y-family DNA polymerase [Alphaproteobacteria bacterium]
MFALIDCNNFFVSCERLFLPALREKPVVVLSNNDGCVISRSNEAKAIGVPMGAPMFEIRDLLKREKVHSFSSNFQLYGDISNRVMQILQRFSPEVDVYSVDEAFLDLSGTPDGKFEEVGEDIRRTVLQWTGIPVSVGIAPSRTLAKLAAGISKKQGKTFLLIEEETLREVRRRTPVEDIWGIGRKLSASLRMAGIGTAEELANTNETWIRQKYNVMMQRKVLELRGIPCESGEHESSGKNAIMASRSFGTPLTKLEDVQEAVTSYTARASRKLREQQSVARVVSVYIQTNRHNPRERYYANYQMVELPSYTDDTAEIARFAREAMKKIFVPGLRYKKCGVTLMDFAPAGNFQQSLLDDAETVLKRQRQHQLMLVVDKMNRKLGGDTLKFGGEGIAQKWTAKSEHCSPRYTTRWKDIPLVN